MVVNLAAHTAFTVDSTVSGTVALTRAQLQGLVNEDYTTDVVTLSGTDILVLDVDLGNRVAVEDLRYYFDSATASGTVASSIKWYYKNYESNPWVALTTTTAGGYYTTTTISGTFFPQYVRMVHTISGTGIVGTAREYEVNSNEDIVDYGTDGALETKYLSECPIGESEAFAVPIYNDGISTATAYVYIANTDTDADDMLKISDTIDGTFITLDDGKLIDGGSNGYPWFIGNHDGTTTASNKLVLSSFGGSLDFTKLEDFPISADTLERGVVRWHAADPYKSEVYYAQDNTFRMYSIENDTDNTRATIPFTMGVRDRFIYDPEDDKIYAFDFNNATTDFYRYDPVADSWSAPLGSFSNSPVTNYPVGSLAFIPSNVLNDGARSIIAMCTTGTDAVDPTNPVRIRLTDYNVNTSWGNLTGYYRYSNGTQTNEAYPVNMLTYQGSNLGAFPSGCQGVLWHAQNTSYDCAWLNYFVIDENTPANHRWHYLDLSNLPRNPTAYNRQDTWFLYNNDTWVYDSANNRVWYVEDPGWQDASRCLHYFECDGTWNRGYIVMQTSYTELDPDGYFWWDGTTADRKRNTLDGKVYGDLIYFVCMAGQAYNIMYSFMPGLGSTRYYEEGIYTTPIFKNTTPSYWRIKADIPTGTDISASEDAVSSTIEIRSSDTAPTGASLHKLVVLNQPSGSSYIQHWCVDYDGTVNWTYQNTYCYYSLVTGITVATNKFYPEGNYSGTAYVFSSWLWRRTSPDNEDYWGVLLDVNGNVTISRLIRNEANYDGNYYRPTNAIFNKNNLVYCTLRGIGTDDDRIHVYDTNLNTVSELVFTGDQSTLYELCLADDEEDIWIIKEDENAIYRYNQNLVQQDVIENQGFGNLNGMCEDGDGGIFIGDTSGTRRMVWHYDANGDLITSFDLTSYVSSIHRIRPDYYGGFWVLDTTSDRVVRFASNGVFIGQAVMLDPHALDSTPEGCWILSETYNRLYFVNLDVVLEKTLSGYANLRCSYDGDNWRGAFTFSTDYSGYLDPTYMDANDPVWGTGGSAEWQEVSKDLNFVPYKTYHQARITLRGDGSVTPEVEKVALPPAVTLYNIAPQSSKNVYLKTVVPQGTTDALRHGKIRTWFSMEE